MQALKNENKLLAMKIRDMENYSRRDNMEISGVPETKSDAIREVCKRIFTESLKITTGIELVRCHRVGRVRDGFVRPILVRFRFHEDKEAIMKNRVMLRGTGYFINDDFIIT